MRIAPDFNPSALAVTVNVPGWPALARTMTSARPLKALCSGAWNGFEARRVAVVRGDDFARAFDLKLDVVLRARHQQTMFVRHGDGDEGKVLAVGADFGAVGLQGEFRRRAGGFHRRPSPIFCRFYRRPP